MERMRKSKGGERERNMYDFEKNTPWYLIFLLFLKIPEGGVEI